MMVMTRFVRERIPSCIRRTLLSDRAEASEIITRQSPYGVERRADLWLIRASIVGLCVGGSVDEAARRVISFLARLLLARDR